MIPYQSEYSPEKIYWLGVKLSGDTQVNHAPDRHPIYHWIVGLPIIYPPLLHAPIGAQVGFVIDKPDI